MDTKTGVQVDATTPKKRHNRVPNGGKGRPKGAKNKVTKDTLKALFESAFLKQKETVADFWKKVMGIDSPEGLMINGKAVDIRQRLMTAMAEIGQIGKRTIKLTAEDIAFIRIGMAYAVGTPLKAQPSSDGKPRMPYIGRHGLPWQWDPMAEQERLAIEAQRDQEKIDAQARQQQLKGAPQDHDDDEDPDTPQLVR